MAIIVPFGFVLGRVNGGMASDFLGGTHWILTSGVAHLSAMLELDGFSASLIGCGFIVGV
jgi:hypothetical protein